MKIQTGFNIGEIVYLKTDKDQQEHIITSIMISSNNHIEYTLAVGCSKSWHDECEISAEKDILKTF